MKRLLLMSLPCFLFLLPLFTKAQLTEITQPGKTLYVTSNRIEMIPGAKKYLQKGCWYIVNNPDSADFVIKIQTKRIPFVGMFAHASFIDPHTKKVLFKTGTSNTIMRVTFNNKRAVLKKLIRRRILVLCYSYKADQF